MKEKFVSSHNEKTQLPDPYTIMDWRSYVHQNFKRFNPRDEGSQTQFILGETKFDLEVNPNLLPEISYSVCVKEDGLTAGFINNINPKGSNHINSQGYIGVIDYKEIMKHVLEPLTPDNFDTQLSDIKQFYSKVKGDFARSSQVYLLIHNMYETEPDELKRLLDKVNSKPDYTKYTLGESPGGIFKMMCEFLSHIHPDQTRWHLESITHKRTSKRLLAGTPFNETAFGAMVMDSGWQMPPESYPPNGGAKVMKKQIEVRPHWLEPERLNPLEIR